MTPSSLPTLLRHALCLALLLSPALALFQQRSPKAAEGLGIGAPMLLVMESAGKRLSALAAGQTVLPLYRAPELVWLRPAWPCPAPLNLGVVIAHPVRFLLRQWGRWQLEGG